MFNQTGRQLYVYAPITADKKLLVVSSSGGFELPHGENGIHSHQVFARDMLQEYFEVMEIDSFDLLLPPFENFLLGDTRFLCTVMTCRFKGIPYENALTKIRFMPSSSLIPHIFREDFRPIIRLPELEGRLS